MEDNKNLTLLYVDDEEINLFIFTKSLEDHFNIITASTAKKALELIKTRSKEIDVVISDMRMPLMSGLDLIQEARHFAPELCYYILTGFSNNSDIIRAKEAHLIQGSFEKPLDIDIISSRINEQCSL